MLPPVKQAGQHFYFFMIEIAELKNCKLLKDLSDYELSLLSSVGSPVSWSEGDVLFYAGALSKRFYILKSGTVLLCFPNGRSLPIRGEGELIGWTALVSPFRHIATGLCLTDCSLLQFPGWEIYNLFRMNANLGYHLMKKVAEIMSERKRYLK